MEVGVMNYKKIARTMMRIGKIQSNPKLLGRDSRLRRFGLGAVLRHRTRIAYHLSTTFDLLFNNACLPISSYLVLSLAEVSHSSVLRLVSVFA